MVSFILPILDGLASLVLTIFETVKGYFSLKIAKYNKQLTEIRDSNEDFKPLHKIGFNFEEDNQEDEEDE